MYYVYILYSVIKDRYYVGSTGQLGERLGRHQAGRSRSTQAGRPWLLVYSKPYATRAEAVGEERWLKRQKSRRVLEGLVKTYMSNPYPLP